MTHCKINKVTGNKTGFVNVIQKRGFENVTYAETVFYIDILSVQVYDCIKGIGYLTGYMLTFYIYKIKQKRRRWN